jgi:two-component sensor histidine kinase
MAINTASVLVLLSLAMLARQPGTGLAGVLTSQLAGGGVARRILPLCLALPILLGGVVIIAQRRAQLTPSTGVAVLVAGLVVGLFAMVGMVAGSLNRADARRREMERRQRDLMNELDHRVKNNLAAVLALAEQTMSGAATLQDFKNSYFGRIRAMARAHEALARSKWAGIDIAEIVRLIVEPFAGEGSRLACAGATMVLPAQASASLSLTLHELATNAAKHGAFASKAGRVAVRWNLAENGAVAIEWLERGGPSVSEPSRRGFGVGLIRAVIPHELGGQVDLAFDPQGVSCRMSIPVQGPR